jgi:hypothetical protein
LEHLPVSVKDPVAAVPFELDKKVARKSHKSLEEARCVRKWEVMLLATAEHRGEFNDLHW